MPHAYGMELVFLNFWVDSQLVGGLLVDLHHSLNGDDVGPSPMLGPFIFKFWLCVGVAQWFDS